MSGNVYYVGALVKNNNDNPYVRRECESCHRMCWVNSVRLHTIAQMTLICNECALGLSVLYEGDVVTVPAESLDRTHDRLDA